MDFRFQQHAAPLCGGRSVHWLEPAIWSWPGRPIGGRPSLASRLNARAAHRRTSDVTMRGNRSGERSSLERSADAPFRRGVAAVT